MRSVFISFCIILSFSLWGQGNSRHVDPFIGTDHMGHTFPGPVLPFGMVQLSPDTDTVPYSTGQGYNPGVYEYCAGYQYNDPTIVGFSHTHLHGTGHSDLGDFLLMPVSGPVKLNPGEAGKPRSGYRSAYEKSSESAQAGYYRVHLSDYGIDAELTATLRTGVHRYTYRREGEASLLLDMVHGIYNYDGKVIWSSLRMVNDTLITGYRQTNGWARNRFIYFAMSFSRPVREYALVNLDREVYGGFWRRWKMDRNFPERSGRKLKAVFTFDIPKDGQLIVKMALSGVSEEGALRNLEAEASGLSFGQIREKAQKAWDDQLDRYQTEASPTDKVIFYTALYHSLLTPSVYQDADGKYRGLDQQIHQADGFTNYTVFSLWDTFRALHPLLVLTHPSATADMIRSMLAHARQSAHGMLPIWSHHANDNWCMTGYHALPVIADAWAKGVRNFDVKEALQAMEHTATYPAYDGLEEYMQRGYLSKEKWGNPVSTTLEYAYNDWTLSRLAQLTGDSALARTFRSRALNYRNVWDAETGFMRPKLRNGHYAKPFDPLDTHGQGFIEGNAWTYTLFVPHDIPGLIRLMGGEEKFENYLDSLFTMELPEKYYAQTEDISRVGIIGNYVHGNEPGHHIPYLYNYTSSPWKTQDRVENILKTLYTRSPSGLCGNDDCGQMSAWYLFGCMGFYPVCPGSTLYAIGKPAFRELSLRLENGKSLRIKATLWSPSHRYVQALYINGKKVEGNFFDHSEISQGGEMEFVMGTEIPGK